MMTSLEAQWAEQEEVFLKQLRKELSYEECWERHREIIERYHGEGQEAGEKNEGVIGRLEEAEDNRLEDESGENGRLEGIGQLSFGFEEDYVMNITAGQSDPDK
jgi:hypothetical protein